MSKVLNRFLKYTKIETTSNGNSETVPGTKGQLKFAKILMLPLQQL